MKKVILSLLVIVFAMSLNAQEKGKIRVGLDAGLALPNAGAGFDGGLDIRYNIMNNVNVGLKFTGGILVKDITQTPTMVSLTASVLSSSLATSDYYFSKGISIFAPFLGGGLGFYNVLNMGLSASGTTQPNLPSNTSTFLTQSRFGGLLRGGFELGHFRMGLEYYLIPRSSLVDINNIVIGTTANSYLNLSIGFYLGGGHWKK